MRVSNERLVNAVADAVIKAQEKLDRTGVNASEPQTLATVSPEPEEAAAQKIAHLLHPLSLGAGPSASAQVKPQQPSPIQIPSKQVEFISEPVPQPTPQIPSESPLKVLSVEQDVVTKLKPNRNSTQTSSQSPSSFNQPQPGPSSLNEPAPIRLPRNQKHDSFQTFPVQDFPETGDSTDPEDPSSGESPSPSPGQASLPVTPTHDDDTDVWIDDDDGPAGPEQFKRLSLYKALVRRSLVLEPPEPVNLTSPIYNPLDFYADIKFIPIPVSQSAIQILQASPALRMPNIIASYALVSHGALAHTWSLLPLGPSHASSRTVVRPVGVLQTYGKKIAMAEAVISDFSHTWQAQAVFLRHFYDSYSMSGVHAAFKVCKDYIFEWRPVEVPRGSGNKVLYLWRRNLVDGSISPAARISPTSTIRNPIDNSELWSLELDVDKLSPHMALLTAFALKLPSSKFHSWFAPKQMGALDPQPIVNFAFQDEGHVYQRVDKFYGDWEDSRARHLQDEANAAATETGSSTSSSSATASSSNAGHSNVKMVRVFKREYLDQISLPAEVIDVLNSEALSHLEYLKAQFGILN